VRRAFERRLLQLCAFIAAALCAILLIESVRSFHRSDTVTLAPLTFVTHRGNLYILPCIERFNVDVRPVTGAPAWPITLVPLPLRTWNENTMFGCNGWASGVFFVFQCPAWFPVLPLALFAVCCRRRCTELLPRTHYLACPACGHLLVGLVQWRCPECGGSTSSRVIEALPPSSAPPSPPSRARKTTTTTVSSLASP